MPFATKEHVIEFFPHLRLGSSSDVTSAAITTLLSIQEAKIRSAAARNSYILPSPTTNPTTNIDWLLYLLNVEKPVAEIIYRRATSIDTVLIKPASIRLAIAKKNIRRFLNGKFFQAFKNVLPTDPIVEAKDVAEYLPGYRVQENPKIGPSSFTLKRWILAESAILYIYANYLDYETNLGLLNPEQLDIYKSLVLTRVAAHLILAKSKNYPEALGDRSIDILRESDNLQTMFFNRGFDWLFK